MRCYWHLFLRNAVVKECGKVFVKIAVWVLVVPGVLKCSPLPQGLACKRTCSAYGLFFYPAVGICLPLYKRFGEYQICTAHCLAMRRCGHLMACNAPLSPFTMASAEDSLEL